MPGLGQLTAAACWGSTDLCRSGASTILLGKRLSSYVPYLSCQLAVDLLQDEPPWWCSLST